MVSDMDKIRIACAGDSITTGFTLLFPGRDSYPSLLQKHLGERTEVRNFGKVDAAARFDADTPYVKHKQYRKSLEWNPDIVLLMLGSNDTKRRNWDPVIFRRDYRRIAESYMALASHPKVVLVAPPGLYRIFGLPLLGLYPETLENGVRPAILEIAGELGLPCIDLKNAIPDGKMRADGVHPQRKGTRLMADGIISGLSRAVPDIFLKQS